MTTVPNQAEIVRAVKACIKGYQAATGRIATGTKVTFSNGIPSVEVTASEDSPSPAPVQNGGINVADFKEELEKRHAARRP